MPAGFQPSGDPAVRIAQGLARLALVQRHASWRSAGRRGLTPTQAQVLAVLAGARADVGVGEVADRLAVTMPTASDAISTLVRKRLVRKSRSRRDARQVVLRLTPAGRRAASAVGPWPEAMTAAASALPAAEQRALLRGLAGLIHELHERGCIPIGRMCVECRYFRPNQHPGRTRPHHCAFIDAPIGDTDLRLDCPDMEPAPDAIRTRLWPLLINGKPLAPSTAPP